MQTSNRTFLEKGKHWLYLFTIMLLLGFSLLILYQSVTDYSMVDYLDQILNLNQLSLVYLFGASCFLGIFLLMGKLLSRLSEKKQVVITVILAIIGVAVQYILLYQLQAVVRYDHLRVWDSAFEMVNTGHLSLTANDGYFGLYPFNISISAFHSIVLRLAMLFNVPEKFYLLSLQSVYLFLIDIGVFFSWKIVRKLYSVKTATLFALLSVTNPMLYVCATGCYTTTLMLPLLMATLYCFILFLEEQNFGKKIWFGFLAGVMLAFGSRLRATVFIAGIAVFIYLIIKKSPGRALTDSLKRVIVLICAVLLGGVLSFGGFTAYQNTYITEDYSDTQMPPIYYLMFAMNPGSKGSYNEDDFHMISQYETLEEKNEASIEVIKERLNNYGIRGTLALAKHKVQRTWADGLEDYHDFLTTSRNYSKLHSYLAGEQKEFFVLYGHIYHVAIMAAYCFAVIYTFLKKKCDSPTYLILLTLLGGIMFHILWESYFIYSFGFSMLLLIPASESVHRISEKKYTPLISGIVTLSALAGFAALMVPAVKTLSDTEIRYNEYAVVQDMSLGECEPLLKGEIITQTFAADRSFDHVGCKVYNDFGASNESIYRMELLSSEGEVLAHRDFIGAETENGGYCYLKFDPIIPEGKETYTIQLTPLHTTESSHLMFGYYNTHQYDIYSDGVMTGLNSDPKADLAFMVFLNTTTKFFI